MMKSQVVQTFVPALPTLWPEMLFGKRGPQGFLPFASPTVRYFYFARNAVWLTAKILGLDQGEVLVPAYHHGVEIEALADAGAALRFYRVGSNWEVDLADVEAKISPRTRAIYLTHYAGFPGPAEAIRRLADAHGLTMIEDCALSLLSSDGGMPLGSTGDFAIFCLYKTLPVPNGGALVINGPRSYSLPKFPSPPQTSTFSHLASSLLQNLELRGGKPGRWLRRGVRALGRRTVEAASVEVVATGTQHFQREHVDLGMSKLSSKLALAQDFASIVERRRRNYFHLLSRLHDVAPPLFRQLPPGASPLFYPLVVDEKARVLRRLWTAGIEAVDFWNAFHPACDPSLFPEVAQVRRSVVELPCHQDLTPEHIAQVASVARAAVLDRKIEPMSSTA